VLGAAGGRVTLSRALFKAKRCSSCHVPLHLHP
jgi:cytochrome c551/c552